MRTLKITVAVLLLSALSFGCSDQLIPTASGDLPTAEHGAELLNFLNGPADPGKSGVFNLQGVFLVITVDEADNLLAAHFNMPDFVGCGGGSFFEEADIHAVENQTDITRAISRLVDAPIYIYELSSFTFCGSKDDWLYEGTHTIRARDNDKLNAGPGANAFGWNGRGVVADPGGDTFRYSEHSTVVQLPNGGGSFSSVEDITVR